MYIHFYAFIYDCVLFNGLTPVYVMSKVVDSPQGNRVQDPARAFFFSMDLFLRVHYRNVGRLPPIYCIVAYKGCMRNNYSGPAQLLLSVH